MFFSSKEKDMLQEHKNNIHFSPMLDTWTHNEEFLDAAKLQTKFSKSHLFSFQLLLYLWVLEVNNQIPHQSDHIVKMFSVEYELDV